MSKPIVAIVGRPNVGKSTFFNKLIGERRSIVEDTPGVTRDRIYGECEWCGKKLTLIDTGGIEPKTNDVILSQMKFQAELAIESADVIIFLCDIRTGVTAADRDVAVMLKKSGKPIVLAVNKARCLLNFMSSTSWDWIPTPSPFPRSTAAAPATCWTPCWSCSPAK